MKLSRCTRALAALACLALPCSALRPAVRTGTESVRVEKPREPAGKSPELKTLPDDGSSAIPWAASLAVALEKAVKAEKPVLADFRADWCGYCKKLDRVTFSDEVVIRFVRQNFIPVKIDTMKDPEIARRYKVAGLPTILFLSPQGEELQRIVGFRDPEPFLKEARKSARSSAALQKLREAAALSPGDLAAQRAYARALFAAGNFSGAIDVLRKALKASPGRTPQRAACLLDLADAQRLSGETAKARDTYKKILSWKPAEAGEERRKALLPLARTLVELREHEPAIPVLDELLAGEKAPQQQRLEALFLRAYVHAVSKDADKAVVDLKAARAADPDGRWGLRAQWILDAAETE